MAWGLKRISSRELSEWMAFAQLEPFGADADFFGHAQTATVIANVNRGKDDKPFTVEDFMPKRAEPKGEQSTDKMIKSIETINIMLGGKDLRKQK